LSSVLAQRPGPLLSHPSAGYGALASRASASASDNKTPKVHARCEKESFESGKEKNKGRKVC
jgi:hypothetical protein